MQYRALALLAVLISLAFYAAEAKKKGPKVTTKVFFDITIDGKEAGVRICPSREVVLYELLKF